MTNKMSTPTTDEGRILFGEVLRHLKKYGKFPKAKTCKDCGDNDTIGKPRSRSGLCGVCIQKLQNKRAREWVEFLKKQKQERSKKRGRALTKQDPGIMVLPSLD